MSDTGRYVAFISYSRSDEPVARWLQRALERYRVPRKLSVPAADPAAAANPRRSRLYPVFRDREDLSGGDDLGAALQVALARSEALIVVCSPAAVSSRWVNEEIRRFRQLHPGGRVLPLLVAGEPHSHQPHGAFPTNLMLDADGRALPEPLAADLRPGGDGRRGALLKLAAGLLGVGVDELRRRDAQRQVRLSLAVAATASVVAAVTIGLAIAATRARDEADMRRTQAEELIHFMLGDLRGRLEPMGRLDVLDAVGNQAMRYFAAVGEGASDSDMLARAMALRQIGEVRRAQGQLVPAHEAFIESRRQAELLYQRSPQTHRHLFELAQAEFWVGQVAWDQARLDAAAVSMNRYMDLSRRLLALAPDNPDYRLELSYAHSNLGSIAIQRRDPQSALVHFRAGAALERDMLDATPNDDALRLSLAESLSWSGTSLLGLDRLEEARAEFQSALQVLEVMHQAGRNRRHSEEYADVSLLLARADLYRGAIDAGRTGIERGRTTYAALSKHDPANTFWRRGECLARRELAELAALDAGRASRDLQGELDAVHECIAALARQTPGDRQTRQDLVMTERQLALQALRAGEPRQAAKWADAAALRLAGIVGADSPASGREQHVLVLETVGVTRAVTGDAAAARAQWQAALGLLEREAALSLPEAAARARLWLRLGRPDAAAPDIERLARAGFADPRHPTVLSAAD